MQIRMTVTQRSLITHEGGESTELSSVSLGCLGDGVLTYTEETEGAKVYHRITLEGRDAITVSRSGAVVSDIRFKAGTRHTSVYRIPPYSFDMTVDTESLQIEREGDTLTIALVFSSLLGGSRQRTEMTIKATPREEICP